MRSLRHWNCTRTLSKEARPCQAKPKNITPWAQRTASGLTRHWEAWTEFLTTASRLYKYPFSDQLMIYAQRPDATACAAYDIWNDRMNRYVRRGAKGIALLDEISGFPRLRYVFDVSDTGVRRNSREPELWQVTEPLLPAVTEMLARQYDLPESAFPQLLASLSGRLVDSYWDNNGQDIRAILDGSLLMEYDEAGVEMQFKSAAAISVTYTLLERCGCQPTGWFDQADFHAVCDFSTPDAVFALGAAVSDMSREVLRRSSAPSRPTPAARILKGATMNTTSTSYSTIGDYQLPNLTLQPAVKTAGRYGRCAGPI